MSDRDRIYTITTKQTGRRRWSSKITWHNPPNGVFRSPEMEFVEMRFYARSEDRSRAKAERWLARYRAKEQRAEDTETPITFRGSEW